jgi:hypothetical protein
MARPLQIQRITPEIDAMQDKFVEAFLAQIKELYDLGVIGEAFYYRAQCKIFRTVHQETSRLTGADGL